MKQKHYFLIIAIGAAMITPLFTHAATLGVIAPKDGAIVGKSIQIDIVLDTQGALANAVKAQINYPSDRFTLGGIIDGNSPITLWVEQPREVASGTVIFSGIVPGGMTGKSNVLVSLLLVPNTAGKATIAIANASVLSNDGSGTALPVTAASTTVTITANEGNNTSGSDAENPVMPYSTPQTFTPLIEKDANVYNGAYFLVFSTIDKKSGIAAYEVAEVPAGESLGEHPDWKIATSPYLLQDQALGSDIYVRAINNAGDETIIKVPAKHPEASRNWAFAEFILAILVLFFIIFLLIRRSTRSLVK